MQKTTCQKTACVKKSRRYGIVAALALFAVFFGLCAAPAVLAQTMLSRDQARDIAFEHAKVAPADVFALKVELDHHRHSVEYEIEFRTATMEYEYEIDAYNGTILEYDWDYKGPRQPRDRQPVDSGSYIGEERARTIALQQVGIDAAVAQFVKLAMYEKHGVMLYDVEFLAQRVKYSCEINAANGEVLAFYRHGW